MINITIPDSVTTINDYAFSDTAWLAERRAENSLVIVNGILIDGKTASGDIVIPDNVTVINDHVFSDCSDLTSVTIPDNVTNIKGQVFWNCTNLTTITYNGINYTSKQALEEALSSNNVEFEFNAFDNAGLLE